MISLIETTDKNVRVEKCQDANFLVVRKADSVLKRFWFIAMENFEGDILTMEVWGNFTKNY